MGKLRFFAALWAAKLSVPALKITGHNGTNFPGELALKICPDFLKYIGKPEKIIAVTGTNGKTTVCNMTVDILEKAGHKVLNNRLGSNINSGISTSLIVGANLFGKAKFKMAVFEVDERSSLRIYPYVKPDYVLITNLFRDSIMRNAHPEYIANFLTNAIPKSSKLILNADDLISCRVAPENERVYFGIHQMDSDITECINLINDMQICPKCQAKLKYEYLRYHHIGRAYCPDCDFKSPSYNYSADNIDIHNMTMTVKDKEGKTEYKLLSDSIFNVYNMVAVVSLLCELGMTHENIRRYMSAVNIVESRYNSKKEGNVQVVMQMAKEKNALAVTRAFDYVSSLPGQKELFLMMNCLGDVKHWSENTCWLYDCDFEFVNRDDIVKIVATGARAKDYKLRLLFAGVPEEKIVCVADEFEATEYLDYTPGNSIYMFYGTDSLGLAQKVREKVGQLAREAAE